MKARNRIKPLLTLCCALLLIAAGVFGTLAYLTGTDTVNNTFTVGNVKITLDEAKVTTDGAPVEGADRVKANEYHLLPGHTYTKDPTVTVKANSEACWLFVLMDMVRFHPTAMNNWDGPVLDEDAGQEYLLQKLTDPKYCVYDETANTLTFIYYYNTTVSAPDTDVKLPTVFDAISVPDDVTNDQLATLENFQITAVAEAIQADGFANAGAAWAAFHG